MGCKRFGHYHCHCLWNVRTSSSNFFGKPQIRLFLNKTITYGWCIFRLDALAWSVIATATWLGGWLSVTAGIVSKRLNLSENFLDHLVGPSFKHLGPLKPIPNSTLIGGVKYTGGGKIGDFCSIFDVHRRLSRKRCEIGRWLLWNVNRKSWHVDNFRWPWVTPNPGFKVTVYLQVEYLKNGAF